MSLEQRLVTIIDQYNQKLEHSLGDSVSGQVVTYLMCVILVSPLILFMGKISIEHIVICFFLGLFLWSYLFNLPDTAEFIFKDPVCAGARGHIRRSRPISLKPYFTQEECVMNIVNDCELNEDDKIIKLIECLRYLTVREKCLQ